MKTIRNKELLVGADFAGFPLKEAVCEHLRKKGYWKDYKKNNSECHGHSCFVADGS